MTATAAKFVGRYRHGDAMTRIDGKAFDPVQDTEWSASNREPASDSEICRMSAQEYNDWITTGKKSCSEDEEVEPSLQSQTKANEEFAHNSDRLRGYDSGRPTSDQMAKMNPVERFVAASQARNRLNPNYAAEARRRRRE
jgi:hypothetical protein